MSVNTVMTTLVKNCSRVLAWFFPHGIVLLLRKWRIGTAGPKLPIAQISSNEALYGRHAGERCFVLGNGPSVKDIDLSRLREETVISVSNGYLHRKYAEFAPRYHCLPQVTYIGKTEGDIVRWFKEMHECIGGAELFLNETEMSLVQRHLLFAGRKVHFLALRESFDHWDQERPIDITRTVPRVESAPVMAIMIAMYMGFSDIFLLGVDHDHFLSGYYTYAFDLTIKKNKDPTIDANDRVTLSRHDDFQSLARLWRQYRALRQIAERNNVRIFNATPGGALDEFRRITISDALEGSI